MVEDLVAPLSQFYGPSAIYAQQIKWLEAGDGVKRAVCFFTVSSTHATRPFDLPALGGFELDTKGQPVGILNVTAGHAVDHFKKTPVFPGHKGIRAAVAYVDHLVNPALPYEHHSNQVRLASLDGVAFKSFVLPGDQLKVFEVGNDPVQRTTSLEIRKGEDVVTQINGLRIIFHPTERPLRAALLEDQLIESMVQSAAATAFDLKEGLDGIPLFQSIGRTRFFAQALEGSKVEMVATTIADGRGFKGNVFAFNEGGVKIAESFDMKAMIVSKRLAERMLGIKIA